MIGLVDLAESGLVAVALDRGGPPMRALRSAEEAARLVQRRELDGMVVEALGDELQLQSLLAAAKASAIPVLVVGRRHGMDAAVAALRAGATDYLCAPFEYEALRDALERLLDACVANTGACISRTRFITQDPELRATLELARSVAASDATVLIQGESGTGKELVARMIHEYSPRRRREMVSVNCAALPAGLLESELFGHERGAFTGAFAKVIGKFELADGTTLLLDEIGELELGLQAKLLRVIQEKQVQRVGAPRPIHVDFRLVATTNRDMAESVRRNEFREDLYYRLNVLPLRLKPLRERRGDVPILIAHFLGNLASSRPHPILPSETLQALCEHTWPGNVRELQNVVERLLLTHAGRSVRPEDLDFAPRLGHASTLDALQLGSPSCIAHSLELPASPAVPSAPPFQTLREMERWLIVDTLTRLQGNRTRAARELGISLRTLRNKINEYTITEPETLPRSLATRGSRTSPPGSA